MPKACDLKRGAAVMLNGQPHIIKQVDVQSPSARGAATLYKMRLEHAVSKQKTDQTFKGDDMVEAADLERRAVSFSYMDGEAYVFMDDEDYSQYLLDANSLGDDRDFIHEGLGGITAFKLDDQVVGIELPVSIELEIVETAPGMKGASASARTKPATLSTGLVVQVPEYLESGERVKVNTSDRSYMSRA